MLNPVNFTDLGPKRLLHVRQVLVAFQVPAAAQRVHVLLVDLGDLVVPVEVRTPNGEPVEHRARSGAGGSSMAGDGKKSREGCCKWEKYTKWRDVPLFDQPKIGKHWDIT